MLTQQWNLGGYCEDQAVARQIPDHNIYIFKGFWAEILISYNLPKRCQSFYELNGFITKEHIYYI